MEQPNKGCLFLLVISLLLLPVLRSGVHSDAAHDLEGGSKEIGADETYTPEAGQSSVTIKNGGDCNGYGRHGTPGTPAVSNPWIISSSGDHQHGHRAAGICILLVAALSWLLPL